MLSKLFSLGYKTKYISSNAESGTKRIEMVTNKNAFHVLKSDGERSIFKNINAENTIKILTKSWGVPELFYFLDNFSLINYFFKNI